MKTLLTLIIILCSLVGQSAEKPKRVYAWKADTGWLKGAKPFENSNMRATPILPAVDLSKWMIPDDNQGPWGRCTGFGTRRAYSATLGMRTGKAPKLSANFQYYNARVIEGTVGEDAGAQIKDVIAGMIRYGIPLASLCPDSSSIFAKPTQAAYADALNRQVIHAYKVDNRKGQDLERALSAGYPVVFGIYLKESFENLNARNYTYVPSGRSVGGHCMVFYKYDLNDGTIWGWNQWGTEWALKGKFCMTLALAHSAAVDDCYVIDGVEIPKALRR